MTILKRGLLAVLALATIAVGAATDSLGRRPPPAPGPSPYQEIAPGIVWVPTVFGCLPAMNISPPAPPAPSPEEPR